MKRTGWLLLLVAASGAGGCVTLPPWAAPPPPPPAPVVPVQAPPPPPVTPDEVSDANAGEIAHALEDELDRAGAGTDRPPVPAVRPRQ